MSGFFDRTKESESVYRDFLLWAKTLPSGSVALPVLEAVYNYDRSLNTYLKAKGGASNSGQELWKCYSCAETEVHEAVKLYSARGETEDVIFQHLDGLLEQIERDNYIVEQISIAYQAAEKLRKLAAVGRTIPDTEDALKKVGICGHAPGAERMDMNFRTHRVADFLDVLIWIECNRSDGGSEAETKSAYDALRGSLLEKLIQAAPSVQIMFIDAADRLERRLSNSDEPHAQEARNAVGTLLREFDGTPMGDLIAFYRN